MVDWFVALILLAGWFYVAWMLINGFRTGSMDTLRFITIADRTEQPVMFWFNTTLNVTWFGAIGAILMHMVRTGGL